MNIGFSSLKFAVKGTVENMKAFKPFHNMNILCVFVVVFITIPQGLFCAENENVLNQIFSNLQQNGSSSLINNLRAVFGDFDITSLLGTSGGDQGGLIQRLGDMEVSVTLQAMGVSEPCSKDLQLTLEGVTNTEFWAVSMLDAVGKPPSNAVYRGTVWPGSYSECKKVKATEIDWFTNITMERFSGKYCWSKFNIPPTLLQGLLPPNLAAAYTDIKVGTCMPDSCSEEDIQLVLQLVIQIIGNNTLDVEPEVTCKEDLEIGTGTIVVTCLLSFLGLLVVLGTLYDVIVVQLGWTETPEPVVKVADNRNDIYTNYQNNGYQSENGASTSETKLDTALPSKDGASTVTVSEGDMTSSKRSTRDKSTAEKILLSFSAYTNGVKILNTSQPAGSLGAINGIRFLSMNWVILGHSTGAMDQTLTFDNMLPYIFIDKANHWTLFGIISATVAVDTFFTLSGLLVSYLTLREMKKLGAISGGKKIKFWSMYVFHRYWRLTPAYMLVLLVSTFIMPYVSNGAFWVAKPEDDFCRETWWANLLYVNNLVKVDKMCLPVSWYLADDMQFYLLAPLMIVPFFYSAIAGGIVSGIFLAVTTALRGYITKEHEYTAIFMSLWGPRPKDDQFMQNLYYPCYTRMGPYIVGIIAGYLLYRCNGRLKMPKVVNLAGWLTCFFLITSIVYGVYPDEGRNFLSVDESVAYVTLHRTGWGLAVAWIIVACATGYGGWINELLSWKAFVPLGRLTYCTYLIHIMVVYTYSSSREIRIHFTDYSLSYLYMGNLCMSYAWAYLVSLAFEAPMMGLEKVIFRKEKKA